MNDIIFIKGAGGLNRTALSNDPISGLAFYDVNFENTASISALGITLFTDTARINSFKSLREFEDATAITSATTFDNAKLVWYHVKEYFRFNSGGELYVGLFYNTVLDGTPVALDFSEIYDMQIFADGSIRQLGIVNSENTFTTGDVELAQAQATILETEHMPLSIVFGQNTKALALTALPDLKALSTVSPNVSVVIAQDGDNMGFDLYTALGYSIPAIGATLGAVSLANVNESIAWVSKFNIAEGGELENPAFGNGELVKDVLTTTVDDINNKGYIFGTKHVGISGTYFNDNHTCDTAISDYAYMSEVRTIDKAIRGVRTALLPSLNMPVLVNPADGTLSSTVILSLENKAQKPLDSMVIASEISGASVSIDPTQNILTNSKIEVTIQIVPLGTARTISVIIGFTTALA